MFLSKTLNKKKILILFKSDFPQLLTRFFSGFPPVFLYHEKCIFWLLKKVLSKLKYFVSFSSDFYPVFPGFPRFSPVFQFNQLLLSFTNNKKIIKVTFLGRRRNREVAPSIWIFRIFKNRVIERKHLCLIFYLC